MLEVRLSEGLLNGYEHLLSNISTILLLTQRLGIHQVGHVKLVLPLDFEAWLEHEKNVCFSHRL